MKVQVFQTSSAGNKLTTVKPEKNPVKIDVVVNVDTTKHFQKLQVLAGHLLNHRLIYLIT